MSLLATIYRRHPCCCSRRSASQDSIANQALHPAHDAGAQLTALVGVGAGVALPSNNPGRNHLKMDLLQALLADLVSDLKWVELCVK